MPRIRTLKPEIFASSQVMNLSRDARLLFIGLITQADDEGRGAADIRKLKAAIFPADDDITRADLERLLEEIATQRLATLYHCPVRGPLYQLPTWNKHQVISKRTPSKYPAPAGENPMNTARTQIEDSVSTPGALHDDSSTDPVRPPDDLLTAPDGKEGKGREQGREQGKEQGTTANAELQTRTALTPTWPGNGNWRQPTQSSSRQDGDFEEINRKVEKLVTVGRFDVTDIDAIARTASISQNQARTALRQLSDRGRLPACTRSTSDE